MGDKSAGFRKLWLIILILCFLSIIFLHGVYSRSIYANFSELVQAQRKNALSKMVGISYNTVKPIVDTVKSGELDKNQARSIIGDTVRKMTYNDEYGQEACGYEQGNESPGRENDWVNVFAGPF